MQALRVKAKEYSVATAELKHTKEQLQHRAQMQMDHAHHVFEIETAKESQYKHQMKKSKQVVHHL